MACDIKYKGENYTREEFISLIQNQEIPELSEDYKRDKDLEDKLISWLSNFGITKKSYDVLKTKSGKNAQGIADILNKVIKVRKGASTDILAEETGHFAIELLGDHPYVQQLLNLVESTETYKKNEKLYMDEYGDKELVKKEVAGKLLSDVVIFKQKEAQKSSINRLIGKIWRKFLSFFNKAQESDVTKLVDSVYGTVATKVIRGETDIFSEENLTTGEFYNIELSKIERVKEEAVKRLKSRIGGLKRRGKTEEFIEPVQKVLTRLENSLEETEIELGLLKFMKHAQENFNNVEEFKNKVLSGGREISGEELRDFKDFIDYYEPILKDIKYILKNEPNYYKDIEDKQDLTKNISVLVSDFDELYDFYAESRKNRILNILNRENKDPNFNAREALKSTNVDMWNLTYLFGSLKNASDNILRIVHNIVLNTKNKVDAFTNSLGRDFTQILSEIGNFKSEDFYEKYDDGTVTGNLISKYNRGQYERNRANYSKIVQKKLDLPSDRNERVQYLEDNPEIHKQYKILWSKWFKENTRKVGDLDIFADKYINPEFEKINSNDKIKQLYDKVLNSLSSAHSKVPNGLKLKDSDYSKLISANRGYHPYRLPMISKSVMDVLYKRENIFKEIPELAKDAVLSRVDDDEFGDTHVVQRPDGTQVKFIPTYYTQDLEKIDNISRDIIGITIQYASMAENFKQMSSIAPDLELIREQIAERQYIGRNKVKPGAQTEAYRALEKFLDMSVYGRHKIKEEVELFGKKVNVTKIINKASAYIRANNLVGSLFTVSSGFFTGSIYSKVEDLVGRYSTQESKIWAEKEFWKNIGAVMLDTGSKNQTNKMQLLFEANNIFKSPQETFANLDKNRIAREIDSSLFYGWYKLADYRIKGKIALAMYDNYRLVDGEWMTKEQFAGIRYPFGRKKTSKKNGKWEEFKTLYDAYEVVDGKLQIKEDYKKHISQDFEFLVKNRINHISSKIDGVLSDTDKSAIHQGTWSQLIANHRGWLFMGAQERFKSKGFNYSTGEYEEGYYMSVGRFVKDSLVSGYKTRNLKAAFEVWNELEDYQKLNVLRTLYELAFVTAVLTVAIILNNLAGDDEENEWIIQASAYQANRILLETMAFMNPAEIPALLNSPAAGINTLENILDFWELFDKKPIKSGPYKDLTRREKKLIKLTPSLKGYYELRDPRAKNQFLKLKALKLVPGI